jgi:hypothetical protein
VKEVELKRAGKPEKLKAVRSDNTGKPVTSQDLGRLNRKTQSCISAPSIYHIDRALRKLD